MNVAGRVDSTHAWRFGSLLIAASMVVVAVRADAQGSLNLAWDDCTLGPATQLKTWACNANTGAPFTMVVSFMPPPGVTDFLGATAIISIRSEDANLPDWWKHGAGECRATALTFNSDFSTGPFSCVEANIGGAGGYCYDSGFEGPDRARMRVVYGISCGSRGPVDPGTEYYAFKLAVTRAKSTGAGACAGCAAPVAIRLDNLQLYQPVEVAYDPVITSPIANNLAFWQGVVNVPSQESAASVSILGIQPNPSFSSASITYAIPIGGRVSLSIFDLSGRLIRRLIDAEMPAGTHQAVWDGARDGNGGRRAPSGTYFVRLRIGDVTDMKRVTLMK